MRRWLHLIRMAWANQKQSGALILELWNTLMLARVSLALVGLGALVLSMQQGVDIVQGLADQAKVVIDNRLVWTWDGSAVWLQWLCFLLACAFGGFSAWYWPRLIFKISWRHPDDAITAMPRTRTGHVDYHRIRRMDTHKPIELRAIERLFVILISLLGLVPTGAAIYAIILVTLDNGSWLSVWIGLALFVALFLLMAWFFWWTRRIERSAATAGRKGLRGPSRWLAGLRRSVGEAPEPTLTRADDWVAAISFFVGPLLLVLLTIPHVRTELAWAIGSGALAFAAVGFIIANLSGIAWFIARLKLPALSLLAIAFVIASWSDNHAVRALPGATPAPQPALNTALARWAGQVKDGPLILVAAAGGASRAGYWTGAVLRALDDRTQGTFSRHVFAISAVSGGSLGAVGYAARIHARDAAGCAYDARQTLDLDRAFLGGDYLAPAIGGLLYPDMLQRFVPFPAFPDRAASLEEGWEINWSRAIRRSVKRYPDCRLEGSRGLMAGDFQAIWADSLGGRAPWVPLVFINGTMVESGKRIITAPVAMDARVFEDSYGFTETTGMPVRASTAILNGARFPIVSPAGTLRDLQGKDHGRIVDGGYFENGGLETLYDLARRIHATMPGRQIIIIEIDNDLPTTMDEDKRGDLDRYPNGMSPGAVANKPLGVEPAPTTGAPILSEVTSIMSGLYKTRSSRGVLAAKRLSSLAAVGLDKTVGRVTFNLLRLTPQGTAMSWTLSLSSRNAMDSALDPTLLAGDTVVAGQVAQAQAQAKESPDLACERLAADRIASLIDGKARPSASQCGGSAQRIGLPLF